MLVACECLDAWDRLAVEEVWCHAVERSEV